MNVSAIVLAAGLSTRMGARNKLLLPVNGGTLVGRTVDVVTRSDVRETIVVLGHEAGRVRAALEGRPVRFVSNPDYAQGMTTSIRVGVGAASPDAQGVMVCLSDLPLVEPGELNRLIAAFRASPPPAICVPAFGGRRGNPVLFSGDLRDEVLHAGGPIGGCRGLVRQHPERVHEVDMPTDHVLRDIDTLEDYQRLAAMA